MKRHIWLAIIASALGFFVDLYDIMILSVVRKPSLLAMGVAEADLLSKGVWLINIQMAGMLLGGFIWGIIGDKMGRLSVLFGSIILYSTATFANAYAPNFEIYLLLRFLAGIGLAGELGAAITLVTEQMPQKFRGIGPAIIGGCGMLGAIFGAFIGGKYSWQFTYQLGGGLGFVLLILRLGVLESGLFNEMKGKTSNRGDLRLLFKNKDYIKKYISICVLGFPVWYVNGVVMTFTPEIAKAWGMTQAPTVSEVVIYYFLGLTFGDLTGGFVSQYFQSRKKAIRLYLSLYALAAIVFFVVGNQSAFIYKALILFLGFCVGYSIVLLTLAAEQYGTNIRATVTTSSLNILRATVIPQTLLFEFLNPYIGTVNSAMAVGVVAILLAFWGLSNLEETFHKDLNYME
ncbi:major facilitator superfamily MFS_1 [Emticicia oligotrophica DSM 17448]|uniref:Major facilitator superfamily MFS_1 n=1 Tax=Emticicia oligotrophica (strain DSM 17448 / CIP 109782 / MTCC 6937 / GPTSA100-15) TaxID=929562 RepID=A0ABM5N1Q7_EMTOG|nr:MFS transporter [Emticicia oligotrophica]AFK03352.1 major facilitator superfamily MFS_1 [Emticicia oligotrophica DSM 17448]